MNEESCGEPQLAREDDRRGEKAGDLNRAERAHLCNWRFP